MICADCQEAAERQRAAMEPRDVREGLGLVGSRDALVPFGDRPLPDVRMGDLVRVVLVSAAVPDMPWCSDELCENYVRY